MEAMDQAGYAMLHCGDNLQIPVGQRHEDFFLKLNHPSQGGDFELWVIVLWDQVDGVTIGYWQGGKGRDRQNAYLLSKLLPESDTHHF